MVLGLAFFIVTAIAMACVAGYDQYKNGRFDSGGVTTKGHITGKNIVPGGNSRGRPATQFIINFAFTKSGTEYAGQNELPLSEFEKLNVGNAIDVDFVNTDPEVNRLTLARPPANRWRWPVYSFAGLFVLISVFGLILSQRSARRKADLIMHGVLCRGEILSLTQRGAGRTRRFQWKYRYTDPAGKAHVSGELPISQSLFMRSAVGGPIDIVVDPNDGTRHAPDIYGARPELGKVEGAPRISA